MALLAALGRNESLTALVLDHSRLGGIQAAAALAASLRANSTLRTLRLAHCILGEREGMRLILGALGSGCGDEGRPSRCGITDLCVDNCAFDLPACSALAQILARGAKLQRLIAIECAIGAEGAVIIAGGLLTAGEASNLQFLNLSWNSIGDEGASIASCPLVSGRITSLGTSSAASALPLGIGTRISAMNTRDARAEC